MQNDQHQYCTGYCCGMEIACRKGRHCRSLHLSLMDSDIYVRKLHGYDKKDPLRDKPYVLKTDTNCLWGTINAVSMGNHLHRGADRYRFFCNVLLTLVLFVEEIGPSTCFVIIHVDDACMTSSSATDIPDVIEQLQRWFKTTKLEEISTFLGMAMTRYSQDGTISILLRKQARSLFDRFGTKEKNIFDTPSVSRSDLPRHPEGARLSEGNDVKMYQSIVGALYTWVN